MKEALGGAKHPVCVLQLDPEAPARHIAFWSHPFLGAAISTERQLYYVVFKDDGSEPGGHCLHNLLFGNGNNGTRRQPPSCKTT